MKNWRRSQKYEYGVECCASCFYSCLVPDDEWYCTFFMSKEDRDLPYWDMIYKLSKQYRINPHGKCKAYERDEE